MSSKFFQKDTLKRLATSFIALSILALALPCNCMAVDESQPVENEHPCHSTSDQSNKSEDQQHNNCCCEDSGCSVFISDASSVLYKADGNISSKNTPFRTVLSSSLFNQQVNTIALIRGSPPTTRSIYPSSKTFQAFLQRWLI